MHLDPSLQDEQLKGEIELVVALVIAASQADGPLTSERIDEVLGVVPVPAPAVPADPAAGATG
jgi:hypothetical protein